MNKVPAYFLFLACFVCISGCVSAGGKPALSFVLGKAAALEALPPYSGSKAKLAIADFDIKSSSKVTTESAQSLKAVLAGALESSNRFIVAEAGEDIIIAAEILEFEQLASGGNSGVGGGGGAGRGAFGGLLSNTVNKARVILNIRIVNAADSRPLSSKKVQGQVSQFADSALAMDRAVKLCVIEALRYVAEAIPQSYYKF
jgi:curli biogenesis system outer membrane secretion channel CsgG